MPASAGPPGAASPRHGPARASTTCTEQQFGQWAFAMKKSSVISTTRGSVATYGLARQWRARTTFENKHLVDRWNCQLGESSSTTAAGSNILLCRACTDKQWQGCLEAATIHFMTEQLSNPVLNPWRGLQAILQDMYKGGPLIGTATHEHTWMEAGAQSMKRTDCRSRIAARLLCTWLGSSSPCRVGNLTRRFPTCDVSWQRTDTAESAT